jgi:DNA-binding transcriptional ArsR family regulator
MQIADIPSSDTLDVRVLGPSLALELSWATHSAWSPRLRSQHPLLQALATNEPQLIEEVLGFWEDGITCFTEFQVLAGVGGALGETDVDRLFELLDTARRGVLDTLRLRSETPAERAAVIRRLAQLRTDDERWSAYVGLFRSLYASMDAWWRAEGMPAVVEAVASVQRELRKGTDWLRLVSNDCSSFHEEIPQIIERRDQVVLGVCALFGKGLYLDLPDFQLLGLGVRPGELEARARTNDLARRIRVLADPTRLAILDHLRSGSRSISDIAADFSLAQPTISVHVKQLREAGLVTATRQGARLELSVNSDALLALTGELSTVATAHASA